MTRVRASMAALTALTALMALVLAVATGCGSDPTSTDSADGQVSGTVTVFAAASLTESFTRIGRDFQKAHPGTKVSFSFAGSSALATQIDHGAPADVFASAAPKNMTTVTAAGNAAGKPVTFARNQLVIAVPNGNPKGIRTLDDLTGTDVKVALCAAQVPCGAAAKKALSSAKVSVTPVTQEQDVKAALSKLKLGEVDAALVYRTDVRSAAKDVDGVEFPEAKNAVNDYPIVVVKDAPNPAAGKAFVDYVRSDKGQDVLTEAGFQAP